MFGSVLLRREGVRGFGFGIGCSGVIQMTQDGHRQVGVRRIGVGMITVMTDTPKYVMGTWPQGPTVTTTTTAGL